MSVLARKGLWFLFLIVSASQGFAEPSALEEGQLPNGLEYLLKESHGGPMVASIVTVGAGSRFEDESSYGASHFLEHMVFNGTSKRSREDINEGIKDFGGYINAFTRREYTCYILLVPREYLEEGLAIQADMLFDSQLPADEFEKEKLVVLEEMRKDYDSGSYRASIYRDEQILAGTPYGHAILGTVDTISGLSRDAVESYYKRRYQPANCRLFLVGDFATGEAKALLDQYFGPYAGEAAAAPAAVALDWPEKPEYRLYQAEEGKPSLEIVWPAPAISSGDYPAQLVLAELLSDPHRSPLVVDGDEALDLSLGIELFADFSLLSLYLDPGESDPGAVLETLSAGLQALAAWEPDPVLVAEAAHGLRVEDVFLQDTYHYFAMMKSAELHMGGFDFLSSYQEDLKNVSAADVRGALERSLLASPPRMIWSAQSGGLAALPAGLAAGFQPRFQTLSLSSAVAAPAGPADTKFLHRTPKRQKGLRTLNNGMQVLVRSDPSSEVFAAHLLIRGRSALEPDGMDGIVTLAHKLLTAGTVNRDEAEIAAELARMGAKLKVSDNPYIPFDNYYTREDFSWIRLEVLDESAESALALLAELVSSATYPDEAVLREQSRMLGSLRMGSPRPIDVARGEFYEYLFAGSRRGRPVSGTAASIGVIDAENLRDFHSRYFSPDRMILSVVTSVRPGTILGLADEFFGDLEPEGEVLSESAYQSGPAERRQVLDKSQVAILAGRVMATDPDLDVFLPVLADILSARLALELREKQGLAYSVGAGLREIPTFGAGRPSFPLLTVQISTAAANRELARAGLENEIARLVEEPPSEEEIFRAVNGRWGRELMRDLSRIHQAYGIGLAAHLGEDVLALEEDKVLAQRQIEPGQLAALAQESLWQGDWIWVLAGGGLPEIPDIAR